MLRTKIKLRVKELKKVPTVWEELMEVLPVKDVLYIVYDYLRVDKNPVLIDYPAKYIDTYNRYFKCYKCKEELVHGHKYSDGQNMTDGEEWKCARYCKICANIGAPWLYPVYDVIATHRDFKHKMKRYVQDKCAELHLDITGQPLKSKWGFSHISNIPGFNMSIAYS